MTDIEYKSNKRINQSLLKQLLIHPKEYQKIANKVDSIDEIYEKDYLNIGSMVDCALFESDKFDKRYAHEKQPPPPQILSFINYLIENSTEDLKYEHLYEDAFKHVGAATRKLDFFIKEVKKYSDYFQNRLNNKGKLFLGDYEFDRCEAVVNSIENFDLYWKYVGRDKPNVELMYQAVILFEHNGIQLKCKIDSIKIDHETKDIYVTDLKTISDYTNEFHINFKKYNYGFQAVFYMIAVMYYVENIRTELKDYKIHPFMFLVESTNHTGSPLIYSVCQETMDEKFEEVNKALELYKFYEENGYERTKYEIDNNCIIQI